MAVSSSIPSTVIDGSWGNRNRVTMSGIREAKASKCGMTRKWGNSPRPSVPPSRGCRSDGTHDENAMAPALHPANAAPARHAATIASHTNVPRNVSAKKPGWPPERYISPAPST